MDAITLLKQDHKAVEALFKKFEKTGTAAHSAQRDLAEKIVRELSVHAAIEEQLFYPAIREAVPDTEDHVWESLEEHHVVKWVASEVDGMKPDEERFRAKVTVLIESVRHHVEEEETEAVWPALVVRRPGPRRRPAPWTRAREDGMAAGDRPQAKRRARPEGLAACVASQP